MGWKGFLDIPIMGWNGLFDIKGSLTTGDGPTEVGVGYLVNPTNVLDINPAAASAVAANPLFQTARSQLSHPTHFEAAHKAAHLKGTWAPSPSSACPATSPHSGAGPPSATPTWATSASASPCAPPIPRQAVGEMSG